MGSWIFFDQPHHPFTLKEALNRRDVRSLKMLRARMVDAAKLNAEDTKCFLTAAAKRSELSLVKPVLDLSLKYPTEK